uniref:Chaperone DnaJ C-terminal domain-containing protein n=1 Tax=Euplotes crassus TaxID=5936 RepID=A0A7S3KDA7_EUPCR|mmetsp:Transcript_17302/g.16966  ORF Transcript_17302/g.16966 Transcript_17302/m.16966 type:complete len:221 (+) Transcript_17302:240-902(+)
MNFEGAYQFKGNATEIFNAYFDTGVEFREKEDNSETNYLNYFDKIEDAKRAQEEEERKKKRPRDLETIIECKFSDIIDGKLVKEVVLDGKYIPTDRGSLFSLNLHHILIPPKGANPEVPYPFKLTDLLESHPKVVKALACKYLNIPLDLVNPKTVIKIPGEGYPFIQKTVIDDPESIEPDGKLTVMKEARGDLYIKFLIKFPTKMTLKEREKMVEVLNDE